MHDIILIMPRRVDGEYTLVLKVVTESSRINWKLELIRKQFTEELKLFIFKVIIPCMIVQ